MKKLLFVLCWLAFAGTAYAADLSHRPAYRGPVTAMGTPCLPTDCSGFYAGGNLMGISTSANVLGQGIQGSFAGGGQSIGGQIGYQFANGTYFIAGEVFGDWTVNGRPVAVGGPVPTWMFGQIGKVGMSLASLFGTPPTPPNTPSGLPATIMAQTISPYVLFGAVERNWGTGWATGGGIEFALTQNWFVDSRYMYVDYNNAAANAIQNIRNENLIFVGFDYKW